MSTHEIAQSAPRRVHQAFPATPKSPRKKLKPKIRFKSLKLKHKHRKQRTQLEPSSQRVSMRSRAVPNISLQNEPSKSLKINNRHIKEPAEPRNPAFRPTPLPPPAEACSICCNARSSS